jgi:hypothetical protein
MKSSMVQQGCQVSLRYLEGLSPTQMWNIKRWSPFFYLFQYFLKIAHSPNRKTHFHDCLLKTRVLTRGRAFGGIWSIKEQIWGVAAKKHLILGRVMKNPFGHVESSITGNRCYIDGKLQWITTKKGSNFQNPQSWKLPDVPHRSKALWYHFLPT